MQLNKTPIRYFISYAHDDKKQKQDCMQRLQPHLNCAKAYEFIPWDDGDIEIGENWFNAIARAMDQCDFGLLMASPAFLSSPFISAHELPRFVSSNPGASAQKRAVPVALKPLDFSGHSDLKGLEKIQIFHDADGKAFWERSAGNPRDEWARQLYGKIIKIAPKL